jgi:4-amino-4-deoxy-L-arabinose transferase-like glycosyltransferase
MTVHRRLALIAAIAVLHALFYIWYQRPDWHTQWTDQDGYRRLGSVLAHTGQFTRFPGERPFVPEVIRTPGYPAFVAIVYTIAGERHVAVALAQTAVFAALVVATFLLAAEFLPASVALLAAALVALFAPLPYFAALVMTEVWTTFLVTVGVWLAVRAHRTGRTRDAALGGIVLGLAALTRPAFVWLPFVLMAVAALLWHSARRGPRWTAGLLAAALTLAPWFAYNYINLHKLTLSPAGGLGRAIWEGSWQGRWSGRLQSELTHTAERFDDRAALDDAVRRLAAGAQVDPEPMLTYVHQWQDIRRIWTTPVDPRERVTARMAADVEYMRVGLANTRADVAQHIRRRLTVGLFVLWAAEIPIRSSDINRTPVWIVRACWLAQAALVALALVGLAASFAHEWWRHAVLVAVPVAYITVVHLPLLTESRQSLPGIPALLVLSAIGAAHLRGALTPHDAPPRPAGLA